MDDDAHGTVERSWRGLLHARFFAPDAGHVGPGDVHRLLVDAGEGEASYELGFHDAPPPEVPTPPPSRTGTRGMVTALVALRKDFHAHLHRHGRHDDRTREWTRARGNAAARAKLNRVVLREATATWERRAELRPLVEAVCAALYTQAVECPRFLTGCPRGAQRGPAMMADLRLALACAGTEDPARAQVILRKRRDLYMRTRGLLRELLVGLRDASDDELHGAVVSGTAAEYGRFLREGDSADFLARVTQMRHELGTSSPTPIPPATSVLGAIETVWFALHQLSPSTRLGANAAGTVALCMYPNGVDVLQTLGARGAAPSGWVDYLGAGHEVDGGILVAIATHGERPQGVLLRLEPFLRGFPVHPATLLEALAQSGDERPHAIHEFVEAKGWRRAPRGAKARPGAERRAPRQRHGEGWIAMQTYTELFETAMTDVADVDFVAALQYPLRVADSTGDAVEPKVCFRTCQAVTKNLVDQQWHPRAAEVCRELCGFSTARPGQCAWARDFAQHSRTDAELERMFVHPMGKSAVCQAELCRMATGDDKRCEEPDVLQRTFGRAFQASGGPLKTRLAENGETCPAYVLATCGAQLKGECAPQLVEGADGGALRHCNGASRGAFAPLVASGDSVSDTCAILAFMKQRNPQQAKGLGALEATLECARRGEVRAELKQLQAAAPSTRAQARRGARGAGRGSPRGLGFAAAVQLAWDKAHETRKSTSLPAHDVDVILSAWAPRTAVELSRASTVGEWAALVRILTELLRRSHSENPAADVLALFVKPVLLRYLELTGESAYDAALRHVARDEGGVTELLHGLRKGMPQFEDAEELVLDQAHVATQAPRAREEQAVALMLLRCRRRGAESTRIGAQAPCLQHVDLRGGLNRHAFRRELPAPDTRDPPEGLFLRALLARVGWDHAYRVVLRPVFGGSAPSDFNSFVAAFRDRISAATTLRMAANFIDPGSALYASYRKQVNGLADTLGREVASMARHIQHANSPARPPTPLRREAAITLAHIEQGIASGELLHEEQEASSARYADAVSCERLPPPGFWSSLWRSDSPIHIQSTNGHRKMAAQLRAEGVEGDGVVSHDDEAHLASAVALEGALIDPGVHWVPLWWTFGRQQRALLLFEITKLTQTPDEDLDVFELLNYRCGFAGWESAFGQVGAWTLLFAEYHRMHYGRRPPGSKLVYQYHWFLRYGREPPPFYDTMMLVDIASEVTPGVGPTEIGLCESFNVSAPVAATNPTPATAATDAADDATPATNANAASSDAASSDAASSDAASSDAASSNATSSNATPADTGAAAPAATATRSPSI
jgi:hypothetical protein